MTVLHASTRMFLSAAMLSLMMLPLSAAELQKADDYADKMLSGVRSVWFSFTEAPSASCPFEQGLAQEARALVSEFRNLGVDVLSTREIEQGTAPDLAVLVLIEASAKDEDRSKNQCAFLVKVEAFHVIEGHPRYAASPLAMRVLAHRTIWYGTVEREAVRLTLHKTAMQAIARFAAAHVAANRR